MLSNLLRLLLAVALVVAVSARGGSTRGPAPAPAASPPSKAAAAALAPAPPPRAVPVSWGFPHAPRPRLSVSPGDTLTFTWDQLHGVYSLGKFAELNPKTKPEPKCEDFKEFKQAKDFLTVEPRREGYYGPQHGSVSWVAPDEEGVYAFADPIEQNCWAGMLLVVDVEKPKISISSPAPAPAPSSSSKGKKNDNNNKKAPVVAAAAVVVVPAAAPAPAPASAAASVSVASVEQGPAAQQTAIEETSFAEEPETTRRGRHAARVAEREAAREQRQMQRTIEEGRVDFERAGQQQQQQHVIED